MEHSINQEKFPPYIDQNHYCVIKISVNVFVNSDLKKFPVKPNFN